ncbi:MAG: DUF1778 domain-containing protein [Alcanivoracaceae bacterium]|nr:DUF1778 domain-containing protein [Alcanivoracaceae bacterium]
MKSTEKKQARLVARVSVDIQNTIQKAAAYSGATITQFLVDSALDKAKSVIKDVEVIKLTDKAATRMMELLEHPPEPNAYLLRAKANYQRHINNVQHSITEQET